MLLSLRPLWFLRQEHLVRLLQAPAVALAVAAVVVRVVVAAVAEVVVVKVMLPVELLQLPVELRLQPVAHKARLAPHQFRHCRLLVEVHRPVVPAVAAVMAPDNPWELLRWIGSFTSKETARTPKEQPFTMSPMEKLKTSVSTIVPLSEPGFPVPQKAPLS
jgi:hypothetical protein